jgi:hypothetical protein
MAGNWRLVPMLGIEGKSIQRGADADFNQQSVAEPLESWDKKNCPVRSNSSTFSRPSGRLGLRRLLLGLGTALAERPPEDLAALGSPVSLAHVSFSQKTSEVFEQYA